MCWEFFDIRIVFLLICRVYLRILFPLLKLHIYVYDCYCASDILLLFAQLLSISGPSGLYLLVAIEALTQLCQGLFLWRGNHRALSVQGCGFFNVPGGGSSVTRHLHLYCMMQSAPYSILLMPSARQGSNMYHF